MKDFILLTKAFLRQTFRVDKSQNRAKGMMIAYIILGVVFIPIFIAVAIGTYSLGSMVAGTGGEVGILSLLITICQFVVILFGIPVVLNSVYFSKDAEMLLGLPLKPATVFAVKFLSACIIEMATSCIMLLFTVVPFVLGAGVFSIALVLSFFVVPLLPLLLAAVIAIPLMYVVSFFKNKGLISSLVLVFLFAFFFVAYYILVGQLQSATLAADIEQTIVQMIPGLDRLANILFPNKFLAISILDPDFGVAALNFLYVLGINAVLLGVTLLISSLVYRRSISKQLENPKAQSNRKTEFATKGKLATLISKDLKEIVRYPSLGFYCLMQVIFAPIMMLIMGLPSMSMGGAEDGNLLADLLAANPSLTAVIVLSMISFFVFAMNYAAGTAISRENYNFYILKILPVSYEQMLDAKGIIGFIFNEVSVFLTLIVGIIVLKLPLLSIVLVLAAATFFSYGFSYFQVFLDLSHPRLKWDNPARGLKNAASIYMTMLLSVAVIIVLVLIYILLSLLGSYVTDYFYWAVVFLSGIGFCWFSRSLLMKNAAKKIEMIES